LLRLAAKKIGGNAELIVSDNGQGMDAKTIEQCFDPFFTTKPIGKGTGLGLSTTYGIVKSHEGMIHLDSKPDQGTTIRIIFPLAQTIAAIEKPVEPPARISYGNGETILVVDDEKEILNAMQKLLSGLGYRSAAAISANEALDKFAALKPDVVLMDINMPEMDGASCAEKIFDLNPHAKVAFITGYEINNLDEFSDRIKASIKTFLTKPVALTELSTALTRMLQD
jgi:CheY-like chemotaxis protein